MKTRQSIVDLYISGMYQFASASDFQKHLRSLPRSGFIPDYVAVGGILYTMEVYDMDGQRIIYANKRTGLSFEVKTEDRYKIGVSDAVVTEPEDAGCYRNDITYAD
jgi:hypothetical protein